MQKPYATAFRLSMILDRVKDVEMRKLIEFDIQQTKHFGVVYLAKTCKQIPCVESLGFRYKKWGEYYVFPEH